MQNANREGVRRISPEKRRSVLASQLTQSRQAADLKAARGKGHDEWQRMSQLHQLGP